jgi:hypothetical protein
MAWHGSARELQRKADRHSAHGSRDCAPEWRSLIKRGRLDAGKLLRYIWPSVGEEGEPKTDISQSKTERASERAFLSFTDALYIYGVFDPGLGERAFPCQIHTVRRVRVSMAQLTGARSRW